MKTATMKNTQSSSFESTSTSLLSVLQYNFNWQNTAEQNTEMFGTKASLLESNGIEVPKAFLALVVLRNIEKAIKSGPRSLSRQGLALGATGCADATHECIGLICSSLHV